MASSGTAEGISYRGLPAAAREQLRRLVRESSGFRSAAAAASTVEGWLSRQEAECLYLLARDLRQGEAIVEIGSYQGRSTAVLASAAPPGSRVHAVDPHTGDRGVLAGSPGIVDTEAIFRANLDRLNLAGRVDVVVQPSVDAAKTYEGAPVGLLFVDGWHSEEAVYADGNSWSPHLAEGAVVVFDDWQTPDVHGGIRRLVAERLVPPPVGSVGKDLVCSHRQPQGRLRRLLVPYIEG